jgi:pimeloyl-ACP methyl ester carboxylesterase
MKVLIVPGLLGSSMVANTKLFLNPRVWVNTAWFALYGVDVLDLAADGISRGPLSNFDCLAKGAVNLNIYNGVQSALENAGFSVDFLAYDWRLNLPLLAQGLASFLSTQYAGEPFALVCHSMGGLIARLAYPLWRQAQAGGTWTRTVYCGTPHGGSYSASYNLANAFPRGTALYDLFSPFSNLNPVNPLSLLTAQPAYKRLFQTVSSWPSLYCLLPSGTATWAALDPNVSEGLVLSNYSSFNEYASQAWLTNASAVQAALELNLAQPRPAEVCIAGTGEQTPEFYATPAQMNADAGYIFGTEGDGIVAYDRAILPGINTLRLQADHWDVIRGGAALAALPGLITDGLVANKAVDNGPLKPLIIDTPLLFIPNPPQPPQPYKQRRGDP